MKKTVTLDAIDPIEIFGVGNKILGEFCSYFPHLKVVARGNQIILEGKESDIAEFNIRFAELVERRHHKMNLTVYDVEDIFSGSGNGRFHPGPEHLSALFKTGKVMACIIEDHAVNNDPGKLYDIQFCIQAVIPSAALPVIRHHPPRGQWFYRIVDGAEMPLNDRL